ncbi:MAG: glycosyltransferase [Candidatus Glassbacteria bacterium]
MIRVLYISYDGLLDPLGRSQIVPYLSRLGRRGTKIWVVSFEKPVRLAAGAEIDEVERELAGGGVQWRRLRYHRRPTVPATLWDIARGSILGLGLVLARRIKIIHARSYVAAAMALVPAGLPGRRFVFDMRGFWPDERVEGGAWRAGSPVYRVFKRLERRFLARADAVISLTRRGLEVLSSELLPERVVPPRFEVIPTCADLDLFRPSASRTREERALRLIYLGSLGSWYMLEEMLRFFAEVQRRLPASRFRLVTASDPAAIGEAVRREGIAPEAAERISAGALPREQVPGALTGADCSVFFIRPVPSKRASCATKFAESIACGVPVVINSGIGDHDWHVRRDRLGIVLESLEPEAVAEGVDRLLALLEDPGLAGRCRAAAERDFSLAGAVDRYQSVYEELAGGKAG